MQQATRQRGNEATRHDPELSRLVRTWLEGARVNAASGRNTLFNETTFPALRTREREIADRLEWLGVRFGLQPSHMSGLLVLTIYGGEHVAAVLQRLGRQGAKSAEGVVRTPDGR